MGFDGLLGNARLKENLRQSAGSGRISHFYLLSGPVGSGKKTLARLLAASAVCKSSDKPCLICDACRKAMADTHPDIITVTDPERKAVSVDVVRDARADMYVLPNEADKKVYIFPQELRTEGQNALLKVLEEPPAYGVCILLTERSEQILTTVRSRCTELKLQPLTYEEMLPALQKNAPYAGSDAYKAAFTRSGGYLGQAFALLEQSDEDSNTEAFAKLYGAKDNFGMAQLLARMEKMKRDPFLDTIGSWLQLLQNALSCRSGLDGISQQVIALSQQVGSARLLEGIRTLQTATEYAQANVSVAAICGWLQWALR